jgi:hypothetical protein
VPVVGVSGRSIRGASCTPLSRRCCSPGQRDFSERGGYFHSDNFVSNELAFQYVIPSLIKSTQPGGIYLGVGPDQNFTYLIALRPRVAFIIDIRRQNMIQHLLYKSIIELSPTRAEFVARLFGRRRPPGVDTGASAAMLFQALATMQPDSALFRRQLDEVRDHLTRDHHFRLGPDDVKTLSYVANAFFTAGPDLTYSFPSSISFGGRGMPTYAQLQMETDGEGASRSYLASEANYRALRELELNNQIVPLVGDFAGERAIRAVGRYAREHGATITAFYTSNVEQYLFQQADDWKKFYTNVATLPVDTSSTFIRSVSNRGWVQPANPGSRSASLLSSISELVKAFQDGRIQTYYDVIQLSR